MRGTFTETGNRGRTMHETRAQSRRKGNFKTTYPSDFSITFSFLIKCYLSTAITFSSSFPTQDGFFIAFTPVHHRARDVCRKAGKPATAIGFSQLSLKFVPRRPAILI